MINRMKCQYCSKPVIYHRKISNELLCKEHFCKTIENKIRKTIRKYNMFSPKEKVVDSDLNYFALF